MGLRLAAGFQMRRRLTRRGCSHIISAHDMNSKRAPAANAQQRSARGAAAVDRRARALEAEKRDRLLAFDGQEIGFDGGYLINFKVRACEITADRPHGLEYSFVLLGPGARNRIVRLAGVDNAHAADDRKRPFDHEHKTRYSVSGEPMGVEPGVAIDVEDVLELAIEFTEKATRKLREWGVYE